MKSVLAKFKQKEFVQNLLIEVIGDFLMLALGLVAGYYIKVWVIG